MAVATRSAASRGKEGGFTSEQAFRISADKRFNTAVTLAAGAAGLGVLALHAFAPHNLIGGQDLSMQGMYPLLHGSPDDLGASGVQLTAGLGLLGLAGLSGTRVYFDSEAQRKEDYSLFTKSKAALDVATVAAGAAAIGWGAHNLSVDSMPAFNSTNFDPSHTWFIQPFPGVTTGSIVNAAYHQGMDGGLVEAGIASVLLGTTSVIPLPFRRK